MRTVGIIRNANVLNRWGNISTTVILTEERICHICEGHEADYLQLGKYLSLAIEEPTYILEDVKNAGTAMFIRHIEDTNINVVIRLALSSDHSDLCSSVITMYRLGDKTLKRLLKKNPLVYKAPEM